MPDTGRPTTSSGGRYAIHGEIGAGGMATVHLGRLAGARGFSRTVAIKVLHASYAKNPVFVERFLDEARLVGRIHHPNVMPTLDVIAEGDDLRIVMDYVAGESLDHLQAKARARGERVPIRIACAAIAGVLHGLHAAHEAKNEFGEPLGIVHLDVSPQNILVGTDGTSRVLDFGVARARATSEKGGALAGGKSAYLAPEQVRGGDVTPRTDVFAASIVLWELVTGEPLFAADNHAATMQRVLAGDIPLASEKVPAVPPRLDHLLRRGLQRDPNQRFATARDMAVEIEQTVAPALPSEVGRWVETIAEATLMARAALVQEMESQSARQVPGLVDSRALYAEQAAVNLPSEDLMDDSSVSSILRPPDGTPPDAVPQRAADGSVRWQPRTVDASSRGAGAVGAASFDLAAGPRGRRAAAATPAPSPGRTKPSRGGRVLLIAVSSAVLALGVAAVAARALFLPAYVISLAISKAATHGVTLTVSDAALSDGGVELRGLTARLAGVPQVSSKIATADVRSVWDPVTRVVLGKVEVTVDGDVRTVADAVTAWSVAHRVGKNAAPEEPAGGQIELPDGHLVWTHPWPDVARIEASAIRGAIGSATSASLGDDAHFLSNVVALETKSGAFGPWRVDVDASLSGTRGRLGFDPAIPDGPKALLVLDAAGESSFDLSIPRLSAAALGVPRTAIGPSLPFPQQVEIALHYGRLTHDQTTATLKAALYGLRIAELGGLVDAHLTGEAAGPPGSPLPVKNGVFTLGAFRAAVSGTVTPVSTPPALRANLSWKGDAVPCSTLVALPTPGAAAEDLTKKAVDGDLGDLGQLARDFGALGEAVGAVAVTGSFAATGTVALDTADLAHARFTTLAKNACGVSLFQAKDPAAPGSAR